MPSLGLADEQVGSIEPLRQFSANNYHYDAVQYYAKDKHNKHGNKQQALVSVAASLGKSAGKTT